MIKKIYTHNGKFHLDEVMAYSFLNELYPAAKLIRTRNNFELKKQLVDKNSILIDVGSEYKTDFNNYDHHMLDIRLIEANKVNISLNQIKHLIRINLKNYLEKNGIYISEENNNKFIQAFRKLDKLNKDKINQNLEEYKIKYLNKDIINYLSYLKTNYDKEIIDPLNKLNSLIEKPFKFNKTYFSIFSYRKYSSLGLVWKQFAKKFILKFLNKEDQSYLEELIQDYDLNIVRKIDNLDNGVPLQTSNLQSIIDSYNGLDVSNHIAQIKAFKEAASFLKKYNRRYFEKKLQELKDLDSIKKEYKIGERIQFFSGYFRGIENYILTQKGDKTDFISFQKDGKYILKTIQTGDFLNKKNLPKEWLTSKPKGCNFVHTALFISEFNSKEDILNLKI